jgi:hypothetical protein
VLVDAGHERNSGDGSRRANESLPATCPPFTRRAAVARRILLSPCHARDERLTSRLVLNSRVNCPLAMVTQTMDLTFCTYLGVHGSGLLRAPGQKGSVDQPCRHPVHPLETPALGWPSWQPIEKVSAGLDSSVRIGRRRPLCWPPGGLFAALVRPPGRVETNRNMSPARGVGDSRLDDSRAVLWL